MKLYFMIGLPTETDEDVRGIVETGGARAGDRARATSSGARGHGVGVDRTCPSRTRRSSGRDGRERGDRAQAAAAARRARGRCASTLKMHENHAVAHRGHLRARRSPRRRRARGGVPRSAAASTAGTSAALELWDRAIAETAARTGIEIGRYLGTLPGDGAAALGPHRRRPRGRLPGQGVPQGAQGPPVARRAASRSRSCCTRPASPPPRRRPRPSWSATTAASPATWAR